MKNTAVKKGVNHNHKKKKKIGETIFIICLLAYPLLQWGIFWLYPNLKTFALPFMEFDDWEGTYIFPHSQGLFYNFKEQIEGFLRLDLNGNHSLLWNAFFNTFNALGINLIILPIAIIIGYALAKHVPGEKFFRVVFFMPNIISTIVLCFAFRFMFETKSTGLFNGPAAKVLLGLGFDYNGWVTTDPDTIWTLIYIFCIWAGLSVNVVLISSAFQRIPRDIIEAARLDGVSFFGEFFHIGLPLIMPTVTTFIINTVMCLSSFYFQPYLLLKENWGANGMYATIPWLIFDFSQTSDQTKYILVATIGIMFSIIMMPLIIFARWIGKKLTPDVEF